MHTRDRAEQPRGAVWAAPQEQPTEATASALTHQVRHETRACGAHA